MLRPADEADIETLIALARRPEIADTLAVVAVAQLEDGPGETLVIEHDGAPAGGVRWVVLNQRSRIAAVETLMIDPAFQRLGVASAAVDALVIHLFGARGMHRLEAEVLGYNTGAQRVFERAGFTREGVRRRAYARRGTWVDGVRYGRLAED